MARVADRGLALPGKAPGVQVELQSAQHRPAMGSLAKHSPPSTGDPHSPFRDVAHGLVRSAVASGMRVAALSPPRQRPAGARAAAAASPK